MKKTTPEAGRKLNSKTRQYLHESVRFEGSVIFKKRQETIECNILLGFYCTHLISHKSQKGGNKLISNMRLCKRQRLLGLHLSCDFILQNILFHIAEYYPGNNTHCEYELLKRLEDVHYHSTRPSILYPSAYDHLFIHSHTCYVIPYCSESF